MKTLTIITLLFAAQTIFAQVEHTVQPKETVYGLTKEYGISTEELIQANPFLRERGLQIGDVLTIPNITGGNQPKVQKPNYNPNEFLEIQEGMTLYSISKEKGVSLSALRELNKGLEENDLKPGDVLRIPPKNASGNIKVPEGFHLVESKETLYSLAHEYSVSIDDFYAANPSLQTEGLQEGSFLKIPQKQQTRIQEGFFIHEVQKGDTFYSIINNYDVDFDELVAINPELKSGLKSGMELKIPLAQDAEVIQVKQIKKVDDDFVSLMLMLPFYTRDMAKNKTERQISLEILSGAKLALDSLQQSGKKIYLNVVDTSNDIDNIVDALQNQDFSQYDAVVGPLYAKSLQQVALYLQNSGLYVVSPISKSEILNNYPNVIIAPTKEEFVIDQMVEKMQEYHAGEPIKIMTDSDNKSLAEYAKRKLLQANQEYQVEILSSINDLGDKTYAKDYEPEVVPNPEQPNDSTAMAPQPLFALLVSDKPSMGQAFVNKMLSMKPELITGFANEFLPAYDIYNRKNRSNILGLRERGFAFASTQMVNVFGDEEKKIIEKFKALYCKSPSKYQMIGFDVVMDIAQRMDKQGNLPSDLSKENTQLSTKYSYQRLGEGKAYANTGTRIIKLFPN